MAKTNNLLLNALPADAATVLLPNLQRVELKRRDVLFEPHSPIAYVYFFEGGLSSEIAAISGRRLEVGCIGHEGFSGAPVALGVDRTPHQAFMQVGGPALRIETSKFWSAINTNAILRRMVLLYVHVFMVQIAATALADAKCSVEQRLARWLLMAHDRLGDELPLTHEFFALMLGVRRPSVTDTLHILEERQCIKAERSLVTIRNRAKLEGLAGDAYGVPEAEYRRLMLSDSSFAG